jgi:hypothetical protein
LITTFAFFFSLFSASPIKELGQWPVSVSVNATLKLTDKGYQPPLLEGRYFLSGFSPPAGLSLPSLRSPLHVPLIVSGLTPLPGPVRLVVILTGAYAHAVIASSFFGTRISLQYLNVLPIEGFIHLQSIYFSEQFIF